MGDRVKDKQESERLREEYFARGGKVRRVPMFARGPRQYYWIMPETRRRIQRAKANKEDK